MEKPLNLTEDKFLRSCLETGEVVTGWCEPGLTGNKESWGTCGALWDSAAWCHGLGWGGRPLE